MPFLDHLEELRVRLMWVVGTLILGVCVGFVLVQKYALISLLQRPIAPYLDGRNLVITGPADGFKITMMISLVLGLVLALPVILYQVWAFLSPALYQHEKRVVVPVLVFATALFFGGVCLSWFVVLPFTLGFLLTFQQGAFDEMIRAQDYFGFATSISLAFGAVFEVPIVALLLTALGILTPEMLTRHRRHAVVGCVVVAAAITPGGDPMSLAAFSVPLYVLYEASVIVSRVVHVRLKRRAARLAAEHASESAAEAEVAT